MMHYVFHDAAGNITGNGVTPDGTVPEGAIECSEEQHNNLDKYKVDLSQATPVIIERDAIELGELQLASDRARALRDIRAQRSPMLDALAGIAGRAARNGDNETASAADAAAQELLGITQWPAFLSATTYDDMKAAIMARYRELVDAAPDNVKTAFREVI